MPLIFSFTLACAPKPLQRPRFTRQGVSYKSRSQKEAEKELCALLQGHIPAKPLAGPLSVSFIAFMPIPARVRKSERPHWQGREHAVVPDIDNLAKLLLDCMTRSGFWHDDRQVCSLSCHKQYGGSPCWQVTVASLNGDLRCPG